MSTTLAETHVSPLSVAGAGERIDVEQLFRAATRLTDYGVEGLLEPSDVSPAATSIEDSLELLGTEVPLIRHVSMVAENTGQSWIEAARELGAPPGERVARAIALSTDRVFFPRNLVDTIDATDLHEVLPPGTTEGRINGVPVARLGNRLLMLVADEAAIRMVRQQFYGQNLELDYAIASPATIEQVYRRKFAQTEQPFDDAVARGENPTEIIGRLLIHAATVGASDIHLEPRRNHGAIFLRIDDVRETFRVLSLRRDDTADTAEGAISGPFGRLMTLLFSSSGLSELDQQAEGEMGSLIPPALRGRIDVRLHFTREVWGIRAVIRLLDQSGEVGEMSDLGIDPDTRTGLGRITQSGTGLILFVGPTGAGKSTTQAAILKSQVNPIHNSVQTMENPVEGRCSMWVQHELSRRNANVAEHRKQLQMLRGVLRSDPNVILMQELRDVDNVSAAVDASGTGHRVMATFHAVDAGGTVLRLRNMCARGEGDESLELSSLLSTIRGIMAQRLVRRVCRHCHEPEHREAIRRDIEDVLGHAGTPVRASARGCPACRHTGYAGRMAVYELLTIDDEMADEIVNNFSLSLLRRLVPHEQQMRTRAYALAADGLTTVAEIHRVLAE